MGYFGQTHVGNDPKAKTNMLLIVEMYCGLITVRDGKVGCPACSPLKTGRVGPAKKWTARYQPALPHCGLASWPAINKKTHKRIGNGL